MGWLDEQLKVRKEADQEAFEEAFFSLAGVVTGKKAGNDYKSYRAQTQTAMGDILAYFRMDAQTFSEEVQDLDAQVDAMLRPGGIMRRRVSLAGAWYKDSIGPLLGTTIDGRVVALLPRKMGGYEFYDAESGRDVPVNAETAKRIQKEAMCFYKPLAAKPIGIADFLKFMFSVIDLPDVLFLVFVSLAAVLVSLLFPYASDQLFGTVAPSGQSLLLVSVALFMVGVLLSSTLFTMVKSMLTMRIQTKVDIAVEAATMMRVLSLPAAFFKKYNAGELGARMNSVNELSQILVSTVFGTGVSGLFSLLYIVQIGVYAPSLLWVVVVISAGSLLVSMVYVVAQARRSNQIRVAQSKVEGMVFSLFSGVQKVKLAGAETRAFSRWAKMYQPVAQLQYAPPTWFRFLPVLARFIRLFGLVLVYYFAVKAQISVAEYMAFNAAFSLLNGSLDALASTVMNVASIRPILNMVKPILQEVPEVSKGKKVVERLSGGLEVNRLTFRYKEDMPLVLDDVSFAVHPGQYVAIVGSTGCGKSTLLRLLLGFESPQKGAIYYDGSNMQTLNLRTLRRNIGVVMQTGKVFQGDIYSNIVVTEPTLSMDEAWQAAEVSGLAEDIRKFPMGMQTVISEGGGGISGGQRQRLMIARAIAPKPKILMFDEATSALDNISQKKVSQRLSELRCTRIVIAHRLSTIRECDRILVLEKGKIIEDGKFEELLLKNGHFAQLVKRQRLDDEGYVAKRNVF